MASYNELLALIDAYINQNGVQAITGQVLNGVLRAMVDQLGRGYSIMGAADPTTDPGTPDGPESWFASVPGTYTNFDGIQIADGELALLSYTPSDGFAKNTLYDGFKEVTAQIDGNVGTPAVGVSYANGILSFDFHNMKGETGDPAGFGSVSATIDDNIGTPSVSVAASGPDTARNFAFNFRNLKGETGVTSVLATVDNTSGNPQCAVSLQGQQLTLAFTGLKGAQGDTGSSIDYPFTIVNNLTTNDATQALSAAMGVQLESEVSQLEAEVNEKADQAELSQLQQKVVEKIGGEYSPLLNLEQGSIAAESGADLSSSTRIRTNNYITADLIKITTSGNKVYVLGYKNDGTYVGDNPAWVTSNQNIKITGAEKYRLVFAYADNSSIIPSDYNTLGIVISAWCDAEVASTEQVEELNGRVFNNLVTLGENGTGKTYVRAIAGHKYRINLITKTWDTTGASAYYAFAWGYSNNDGASSTDVGGVLFSGFSGVKDHYDIDLPTDATHLVVRAAGKPGVKIYFIIEDLTIGQIITPYAQTNIIINGTFVNGGNAAAVRTQILPLRDKVSKYVIFHTNRPNTNGCEYHFGYVLTSSQNDIWSDENSSGLSGVFKNVNYSANARNAFIELPQNAVGIGFVIVEYNVTTGAFNNLRKEDFDGYTAFFTTSQNEDALYNEITQVYPAINLEKQLRNGSQGNSGNAYVITLYGLSTTVIPVSSGKKYRVVFDKLPQDGFNYYYRLVTYDTVSPSGLWDQAHIVRNNTNIAVPITTPIEIEEGEYGMTLQLTELDSPRAAQGTSGCIPLRVDTVGEISIYDISSGITNDVYECLDELYKKDDAIENGVHNLNKDKIPMLVASCRNQKLSESFKDFQMLIVTDSHKDDIAVEHAITAANEFATIDALIHNGDYDDKIAITTESVSWGSLISKSKKPCYFVIGNHEVGTYPAIRYSLYESQLYDLFIKPIIEKVFLGVGEYSVGKCYYYHDFDQAKIRLIVLNEYEAPHILDTDNPNWEAIPYNSELENYREGLTYSMGDEVNVDGYTDYSFRAKQTVTVSWSGDNTAPSLKYRLGYRWIGQTQAQWFLDRLADAPSGYQVIIACHNPFSQNADVDQTKMFSQKNGWVNGYGMQNYMTTDFIAEAINAFVTRNASFSIQCNSEYPSDMPSYSVGKDFSGAVATFHSILGGHVHQDCVWKHHTYKQYQVTPICSNTTYWAQKPYADIRTINTNKSLSVANDSLTVVSFGENRIGLVKIGVNVTENGAKRDFEVINTQE